MGNPAGPIYAPISIGRPAARNLVKRQKQKIKFRIEILFPFVLLYQSTNWGHSSAGRAFDWQSRGQEFDPPCLHQNPNTAEMRCLLFLVGEKGDRTRKSATRKENSRGLFLATRPKASQEAAGRQMRPEGAAVNPPCLQQNNRCHRNVTSHLFFLLHLLINKAL